VLGASSAGRLQRAPAAPAAVVILRLPCEPAATNRFASLDPETLRLTQFGKGVLS